MIARGTVHKHLGIGLDLGTPGEVEMMMHNHVKKLINEIPEEMKQTKTMAAIECLFKTDGAESPKLDKK